jgi:hypothetical protein
MLILSKMKDGSLLENGHQSGAREWLLRVALRRSRLARYGHAP